MKREDVKKILPEVTDEQLKTLLDINGTDIEGYKKKVADLEAEIVKKDKNFKELENSFEDLKQKNADAEDYKGKFEELQKKIKEDAEEAEKQRIEKEEADKIEKRFMAALGSKKFSHDAIRIDYLKKFGEALKNEENAGKSDIDIFTELTKEDASAFSGKTPIKLEGGSPKGNEGLTKKDFDKMSYSERLKLYAEDRETYDELSKIV